MPKGVTQDQVNAAIDALIGAGERPTIERVRAALGTGSPNTLTRMLDAWWAALGSRLAVHQHKIALPDAPAEVVALASQLWEQALRAAHAEARAALQGDRTELEANRARLATEHAQVQQTLETHRQAVATAQQAQSIAETRLADSQQLADRQSHQLADVLQQRDAVQARADQLTEEMIALGNRLQKQDAAAAAERESLARHVMVIEDRSHLEVDRARQETKDLRSQIAALEREMAARERQRDEARTALATVEREAAGQRARAGALEQQVARLGELHATLQATLAKGGGKTATQRAPSRKPVPTARKGRANPAPPKLPARR